MIIGTLRRWFRHEARGASSRRTRRESVAGTVESLEGRALLSRMGMAMPLRGAVVIRPVGGTVQTHPVLPLRGRATGTPAGLGSIQLRGGGEGADQSNDGWVRKSPQFYELYTGPKRDGLNVVAGRVSLKSNGRLDIRAEMAGRIETSPATAADNSVFVWGFNRGSALGATNAPFPNRGNVKFDAVVVVQIQAGVGTTGFVRDLVTGVQMAIDPSEIKVEGKKIRVEIPSSLLPTPPGGVPASQSTWNLWPRSGLGPPSTIASFLPENGMAPVRPATGND